MKKILIFVIILVLGTISLGLILKKSPVNILPTKTLKGFSLSPKSFNEKNFLEFFEKANEGGNILSWAGKWEELKDPKSAPHVVFTLAKNYGYTPILIVSAEIKNKEDYKNTLSKFAKLYKPKYMGLGNELNYTFRNNEAEIEKFIAVFDETYGEIKKVSPSTKVFTTIQYETPSNAIEIAKKISKADLIALTTYPEILGFTDPQKLPDDYYTKLDEIGKPIVFTEIGWRGINEDKQAQFITRFLELTKDLNPEFVIWPFLYDQKATKPFDNLGLFDHTGPPRKAWEIWKTIR